MRAMLPRVTRWSLRLRVMAPRGASLGRGGGEVRCLKLREAGEGGGDAGELLRAMKATQTS